MGVVYRAKNKVNGKRYIGKTATKMKYRKKEHEKDAINGSEFVFHQALRKYGFDNFEWKVIGRSSDSDELIFVEIAMIRLLKTKVPNGYNMTDGGEGAVGVTQSSETIAKRVKVLRGKKRTKEQRANISRGHLESEKFQSMIRSPERRARLSKAQKGKRPSDKCIVMAVKARTGSKHTKETKVKIGLASAGRKHTEETKAKISLASVELWKSKDFRDKMKQAKMACYDAVSGD